MKRKVSVEKKLQKLTHDLWGYVKDNCKSLESWKHNDAINDWLLNKVGKIYDKEVALVKAQLEKQKAITAKYKEQVRTSRETNRKLKRQLDELT
jgi:hypothetical protein